MRKAADELRITYWSFYGFSVPYRALSEGGKSVVPLFHEGDWESIELVLGLANAAPRRVEFAAHGGTPVRVAWASVERIGDEGTHPVAYVARNSHASYATKAPRATKDNTLCVGGLCAVELRDRGTRWAPWEKDAGGLVNVQEQPWYGFGGAWGKSGEIGDATGPLGPSVYKLRS